MQLLNITRHEEFEMAHILPGYRGGCGNIHGHSYKIEVTVTAPQSDFFGMLMDFKDLKKAINACVPDHRIVLSHLATTEGTVEADIKKVLDKWGLCYEVYPNYTTAENMCSFLGLLIEQYIHNEMNYGNEVQVTKVKLWETTNSYATWTKHYAFGESENENE